MDKADEILIGILARADRAWLALRSWQGWAASNRYFALQALPFVPWHGGGSDLNRKQAQLQLDDLVANRLVERSRAKTQTSMVALTPASATDTRHRCGLPGMAMSIRAMAMLADHSDREPLTLDRQWVREIDLNNGQGWDGTTNHENHLVWIGDALLPAMHAGYVEANSDSKARGYYRLLPRGWAELDRIKKELKPFDVREVGKLTAEDGMIEKYTAVRGEERRRYEEYPPDDTTEIGCLPLSCSMAGTRITQTINAVAESAAEDFD